MEKKQTLKINDIALYVTEWDDYGTPVKAHACRVVLTGGQGSVPEGMVEIQTRRGYTVVDACYVHVDV